MSTTTYLTKVGMMSLQDGKHPLPFGKLAAVVTYLQMHAPPNRTPVPAPTGVTLAHICEPDPDWYQNLFREIGTPWLWTSRLQLERDALNAILTDEKVHIHAVRKNGQDIGLVELDFRRSDCNEIAFFGLIPNATGQGQGRWMMDQAISKAFKTRNTRLFLHTCTLDSPAALPFYQSCGFKAYKRAVEILDDPRHEGLLSVGTAPHMPML